jgi:hypothetical protein
MAEDTRIYFGRPGLLAEIRSPKGTVAATRQRRTSTMELGVGGTAVDQMVGGARTYVISYEQLTRADWNTLEAFAQGLEGPGPFAFLDPGQRNMLPANMSGATSVTNDTDNFSIAGSGCTIASDSTYTDAGPRTLAWTLSNASAAVSATAALTPDWPSSVFAYGVPAVVGRSLCFSCYVRGGGADPTVQLTPQLIYRDITGAILSTTSGTAVTTTSSAFAQMFVTAVAPASAVYADWKITAPVGQSTIYDDFESGSVADWQGGNATFASSTSQAHGGTRSGLMTVTGSPSQAAVQRATRIAVTASASYTASMWAYSPAGYASLQLVFDWYDASGVYITSSSSGITAIAAATWEQRTVTASAPSNATTVSFGPVLASNPPNGTQLFIDDMLMTGVASTVYLRRFMLNEGATPDAAWSPGTGVWPVRFNELPSAWPYLSPELRERPSVALTEDVT